MNTYMKEVWKRKWINALRSGEYTQGSGYLEQTHQDFEEEGFGPVYYTHCCLGVLECVVNGNDHEWTKKYTVDYHNGGEGLSTSRLLLTTREKAGLRTGSHFGADIDSVTRILARMNDGYKEGFATIPPKSFKQIADWIEKNIEGY